MYDSLVGFDLEKGGVGPGVAERWVMSEDGLSWTFHLRAGQTFHNGDPPEPPPPVKAPRPRR